jgi:hypothetical protein
MRICPGTDEQCLYWHAGLACREDHYGDVRLDGLNLLGLGAFEGNVWTDEGKVRIGLFIDEGR